jgi:hypothetical protein
MGSVASFIDIPTKGVDDKLMTEFVVKNDWAYSQLRVSDRTVILDSIKKKTLQL